MSTDFHLYINDDELTPPAAPATNAAEWDATWEERIDGVGAASVTIQDRLNNSGHYGRRRDIIRMTVGLTNVFYGEVTRSHLDLPPGRPYRRWKLTCSDWNSLLDLRLVGIPNGNHWTTDDGGRTHYPIDIYPTADPYDAESHSWPTDRETIHRLFRTYIELPLPADPSFIDAETYVKSYLPSNALWIDGQPRIHWDHTTLRGVMDELRSYAAFPLFYWIDPDLYLHWTILPDPTVNRAALGLPGLFPIAAASTGAPAIIADELSGSGTRIGGRGLFLEYDGSYMPERAYISGVTDFIYNGGNIIDQGTGWRNALYNGVTYDYRDRRRHRHVMVDAQSVTAAQRDAVGGHYERYGNRARIKGSVTVGRPDESVDGWRVGQMVTIIDARLPDALNNRAWPIQRVAGHLTGGQNFRTYTLEFGDAPIERFSQKYQQRPQRIHNAHHPAREHKIIFPTTHLRPSTTYLLRSQLVDHSQQPLRQGGVPVTWSMTVKDGSGAVVGGGSLTALRTTTNRHGESTAELTTGATTDLHYQVRCVTSPQ